LLCLLPDFAFVIPDLIRNSFFSALRCAMPSALCPMRPLASQDLIVAYEPFFVCGRLPADKKKNPLCDLCVSSEAGGEFFFGYAPWIFVV
jgi:hypothetical protein